MHIREDIKFRADVVTMICRLPAICVLRLFCIVVLIRHNVTQSISGGVRSKQCHIRLVHDVFHTPCQYVNAFQTIDPVSGMFARLIRKPTEVRNDCLQ
jgi:hypothetical protein